MAVHENLSRIIEIKKIKYLPSTTIIAFFPLSKTSEIQILVTSLASVGKGLCSSKYCSPCNTYKI